MRELKGDWRDIFNCFMIALDLRKLVLAFIGGMLTFLVLGVDSYFLARMMHRDFAERSASYFTFGESTPFDNLFFKVLLPAHETIFSDPVLSIAYLIVVVLTLSVIWSYFGGAITRIAAIEITKDERIEVTRSLEFVKGKYNSYFWSLAASAIGFLFFFFVNAGVGLLGREWLGLGNLLGVFIMVLFPLAVLAGFIMTMLSIGTVFGYPLFYPAISVEGTDMFDAISRGFSYVFSRPVHYALYQVVALAFGVVSIGFVWGFGWLTLKLTHVSGGLGMGLERFEKIRAFAAGSIDGGDMTATLGTFGSLGYLSAFIYLVWMVIIVGFLASYALSYFFSSQTMVYLLLRKKVDGIELNEVFEEKGEEEPLFPLPKAESTAQKAAAPAAPAKPLVPLTVVPGAPGAASTPPGNAPAGGGPAPTAPA